MSPNALHSHESPDWYTPDDIVDAARTVLGTIDLDPASCAEANARIRATRYFTVANNGLSQPWAGRVFLHAPGGLVNAFWGKLMVESHVTAAVWVGYSLEQLQTLQTHFAFTPLDFAICVPKRRIPFVENRAKRDIRLKKVRADNVLRLARGEKLRSEHTGPSHANYISYIGNWESKFVEVFSAFGACARA